MKNKIIIYLPVILIGGFLIISSGLVQNTFWMTYEFLDPHIGEELDRAWNNKPNEFLLEKLDSKSTLYRATAANILINRKDKNLVPIYLEMLKSNNAKRAGMAIRALGKIGDKAAIFPLMRFVENGTNNIHYRSALMALSELHYEPIIPEIIKLARAKLFNNRSPQQEAIEMMPNFDNENLLTILKDFKENGESYSIRVNAEESLNKIEARRKVTKKH